jgi:lipopolysaccharide transport system ATP-binding protein
MQAAHETKDVWALRDVSFTVTRGTILGIIGPAGAGKTTLLKILARMTLPTSGRVIGRGRVVPLLGVENTLNGDRSGRENIMLCAALSGIPRGQIRRRVDDVVDFAGMGDVIDMPLKHYSSEMRVRLAFSVVMQAQPDILLADEMVALVDQGFRERLVGRLLEASASGMTTLLISKDVGTIARMCHQVLWINAGQTVRCGDPTTVVNEYQRWRPDVGGGRNGDVTKGCVG